MGLRQGTVRGVVATNALELGIDIGRLDVAVLSGYPGTVASVRQQMGRAGRRQGASVGVLVAGPEALDQYIIAHPEWLLARSPEHARLNPDNEVILAGHLACAAAELPLEKTDRYLGNPSGPAVELLDDLVDAGQLYRAGGRYYWAGDGSPSTAVSLRTGSPDRVVIQVVEDAGRPQVIGELDRSSAPSNLYDGAIYLHEGRTFQVERLDWDGGIAYVHPQKSIFTPGPSSAKKSKCSTTGRRTAKKRPRLNPISNLHPRPVSIPVSSFQLPTSSFQLPTSSFQPLGRRPRHQPGHRLQNPAPGDQRGAGLRHGRSARTSARNPGLLAGVVAGVAGTAEGGRCLAL